MLSNIAFTGVTVPAGVSGMSRTLHVAAAAAHPASVAHAAAAAIAPQRKRRTAAATASSVDRGSI